MSEDNIPDIATETESRIIDKIKNIEGFIPDNIRSSQPDNQPKSQNDRPSETSQRDSNGSTSGATQGYTVDSGAGGPAIPNSAPIGETGGTPQRRGRGRPRKNVQTSGSKSKLQSDSGVVQVSEEKESKIDQIPRKLTNKQLLVQKCVELYPDISESELSSKRVAELQVMISNHKVRNDTARLVGGTASQMPNDPASCHKIMGGAINQGLSSMATTDLKAETLYNFHIVTGGVLEMLSDTEAMKNRTGGMTLVGLTEDIKKDKETFLMVLKDLHRDYGKEIDPYINSLTVYGLYMSAIVSNRLAENKKKLSNGSLPASRLKLDDFLDHVAGRSQPVVVRLPPPSESTPQC